MPAAVHGLQHPGRYGQPKKPGLGMRQKVQKPPFKKSPAQIQFERNDPPTAQYQLQVSCWRNIQAKALGLNRAAEPHPRLILKQIAATTDTYIREPGDRDEVLFIWGDADKAAEAQGKLAQWEQHVRQSVTRGATALWPRTAALDGRAEHRQELQQNQRVLQELIQQAELDYPVEASLLWPKDLDMEQFKSINAKVLDDLRTQFKCQISFLASETKHIMIAANSQAHAIELMTRMANLIKELIARGDQLMTVNLVQLPDYDIYRDRVGLLDMDPKTRTYLPTLHGNPAPDEEKLNQHRRQVQIRNRKKVKKTIDSAIKKLRISEQHVRFRVVFGELGFLQFQKPSDGADTYSFEDFYDKVTKERTKLTMNSLPVRQGEITDLVDILDDMEGFSDRTEYYAVFFDFPGASRNSSLRLELVFDPIGENETENREKRWIELGDMVSKLQISLFNFDRPDYQVTLDSFPLHIDKMTRAHMSSFQARVTMDRPPNGIKSIPRRRAKHPHHHGLNFVSELTMLKWRFKNGDGVFELRRKDTYNVRQGQESGGPIDTRWHALYYYPEWDRLMGDFASIKPGEDVEWVKSAATFFPEGGDEWSALPRGFKTFITEVEEIQDLLAEAIRRVAKGKGRAARAVDGEHSSNG